MELSAIAFTASEHRCWVKVTDEQLNEVNLHPAEFHGKDWNYTLKPRRQTTHM